MNVCVCEREMQSQNASEGSTVIMETSWSPVIGNISLCSYHPEHHLSVPLPVPDLQLDGHTTARGRQWHWIEAQRQCKYGEWKEVLLFDRAKYGTTASFDVMICMSYTKIHKCECCTVLWPQWGISHTDQHDALQSKYGPLLSAKCSVIPTSGSIAAELIQCANSQYKQERHATINSLQLLCILVTAEFWAKCSHLHVKIVTETRLPFRNVYQVLSLSIAVNIIQQGLMGMPFISQISGHESKDCSNCNFDRMISADHKWPSRHP